MIRTLRLALLAILPACALHASADELTSAFLNPPADTRPGCYWYWINDNISKEGITRDLEAMARVGIGRAYIGHIFNRKAPSDTPVGSVKFMSDAWWEALQWAVKEADRCGVEIGFFNSPGWSQSGGPWVKPSQSMRYLDASETIVQGGQRVETTLPVPEIHTAPMAGGSKPVATGPKFTARDFQDVRVVAFRQPETEAADLDMRRIKASSPGLKPLTHFSDDDPATSLQIGPRQQVIEFELDGKTPVRSLRIDPLDQGYTLTCTVTGIVNGQPHLMAKHTEGRGHQGPRNKDPILIPLATQSPEKLRLTLTASKPAAFSSLRLSRRAVVGHHVRKQLGETSPSVLPPWDAYVWPEPPYLTADAAVDAREVLDLTAMMDRTGRLVWDAPPGRWVVMRTGMVPIGTQCAPASPESQGLEVDKLSKEHIRALFDGMVGEFLRRTPPEDRKALKYVIADSYETGPQNWTDAMVEKFEARFGYSPVRYLPCLTGRVVDSHEVSTRFLWDWRRLVAESIARDYVGGLREVAGEHNLTLWLENYGHWGFPSEFLLYGSMSDQVGGEFWESGDPRQNIECRAAASCSHIYGRTAVYAEAFTSNRSFEPNPASLKSWCDWVYGTGVNHLILHVNIHQPDERKPGIIQWFGTAFNRHNTWFEQSKAFIDYTRRCAVLLKSGRPVVDVAYYIGENAPAMQGPRSPRLPDGCDFDFINSDVLVHRAKVVDGRITVPGGPSYVVLVLPDQQVMRPEVADAIRRLVAGGTHVVGPKPASSPSLAGYPECDARLRAIADEVWGETFDPAASSSRRFGKGMIHHRVELGAVFERIGLQPDILIEDAPNIPCRAAGFDRDFGIGAHGGIAFHHRTADDREIYFLANTRNQPVTFTASLRASGRQPWLWNAVTGTRTRAEAFTRRDGRTRIPLQLAPTESVFLVLEGTIGAETNGSAATNTPAFEELATLDGPWTVRFDGQGAPAETVFPALTDWSKHPDESIRHYSGAAVYENTFTLNPPVGTNRRVTLDLGAAAVMATVSLNGRELGTLWCPPWRIDIHDHLQAGKNTVRIKVVNTWHNRLVADAGKPKADRLSHISQPYPFNAKAALATSGLLGPVRVLQVELPGAPARRQPRPQGAQPPDHP